MIVYITRFSRKTAMVEVTWTDLQINEIKIHLTEKECEYTTYIS
jgi:hypothetical protein